MEGDLIRYEIDLEGGRKKRVSPEEVQTQVLKYMHGKRSQKQNYTLARIRSRLQYYRI